MLHHRDNIYVSSLSLSLSLSYAPLFFGSDTWA